MLVNIDLFYFNKIEGKVLPKPATIIDSIFLENEWFFCYIFV